MASNNPFAQLFSGFTPPVGGYQAPNSALSQYTSSLKKKQPTTSSVSGAIQSPFSASPAATGTTPPPISPAVKSTAGQDYLKSISAPAETQNSGMTTPSGVPVTGDPSKYAGVPDSQKTPPAPAENPALTDYKSAYADYIKALTPSDDETTASKNLSALQLQADKDQEEALSRGDTLGFASGEAERVNRNNSFGITAASNALNAFTNQRKGITDANKARVDFTKSLLPDAPKAAEPFTLSPGETRFDSTGKAVASGGAKPMSATQEQKQIDDAEKATASQASAAQSIGLVNSLLTSNKDISGIQNPMNLILGGALGGDPQALNQYNQLQGLLKLGIRGLLKGQGAVSDYEGRLLGSAASALGRNLPDADFKQALKTIRGVLQTNNGQEVNVIVKDKNGKVIGTGALTGKDIYDAVSEGNTIEYQ